jgi:hypothetical protein
MRWLQRTRILSLPSPSRSPPPERGVEANFLIQALSACLSRGSSDASLRPPESGRPGLGRNRAPDAPGEAKSKWSYFNYPNLSTRDYENALNSLPPERRPRPTYLRATPPIVSFLELLSAGIPLQVWDRLLLFCNPSLVSVSWRRYCVDFGTPSRPLLWRLPVFPVSRAEREEHWRRRSLRPSVSIPV